MPLEDRPIVVLGMYGATLDRGGPAKRWHRWRPTVAVCSQPDLVVHRFELLHDRGSTRGAEQLVADLGSVSPETEVRTHPLVLDDPWDFEEVFGALHDFARGYAFDVERERYLVHITTGTHVMQICWFLLTVGRHRAHRRGPPPRSSVAPYIPITTVARDLSSMRLIYIAG